MGLGLSRLYAARAFEKNDLALANKAVQLARSDPEAYSARAAVLAKKKRFTEATVDLKRALDLSPRDAELWINLGDELAQLEDTAGALRAYSEATRLAPHYARPHWLLGNCLLKAARIEDGFIELRKASTSSPSLFVNAIELAWQSYNGEAHAVEQALQPQTVHERIALALFFSKHGRSDEAVLLFRDAGRLPKDERLSLLRELLDSNKFVEAYEVWSAGRDNTDSRSLSGIPSISNGGFEGEIVLDDPGFGWRFAHQLENVSASIDVSEPRSGKQSLRIDWHGDPDRSVHIVEQLVLVAPKARYRMSFAARTKSLTTICPPLITVFDPKAGGKGLLGQSSPLSQDSSGWCTYSTEFTTDDTTKVILIGVTREAGSNGPCPIFGSVWLDDFWLENR
jgi:tetratricopeptide (TPR) repeat protein